MSEVIYKQCKDCGESKELTEFYRNANRTKNVNYAVGYMGSCKVCHNIKMTDYQKNLSPKEKQRRRVRQNELNKQRGSCNIERRLWRSAKNRATQRKLAFDLEVTDIVIPVVCPILGIPIKSARGKTTPASPSIDRINNSRGYVKDNIVVVSWRANRLKSDGTAEEHLKIGNYYEKCAVA